MEIAIAPEMRCYSGGLGVLAGDYLRAAADLALPMVFVTLANREGYVLQEIDAQGNQIDRPHPWEPGDHAVPLDTVVTVPVAGRDVAVRAWMHVSEGVTGARVATLLLDTDLPQNSAEDRALTGRLYGGDARYRLRQEAVLGIGAARLLSAIGLAIGHWHLNEGHAALLPLELVRAGSDIDTVRRACVFTTHTPVAAGRDRFAFGLMEAELPRDYRAAYDRVLPDAEDLDMTLLAMRLSGYANAVSKRHRDVASDLYPGEDIAYVTNGVHPGYWAAPAMQALFDAQASGWREDSDALAAIAMTDPARVAQAHEAARANLIESVRTRTGRQLDPQRPILCYARRMTGYKRPTLMFEDLDRLRTIARRHPFTLLIAGKAHPNDGGGKDAIRAIHDFARQCDDMPSVVFLPGYGLELAHLLVGGADVWLNLPVPPLEASGTSGMKAAINGGLNLSTPDGWWLEGVREGANGWTIGDGDTDPDRHGALLLDMLAKTVLPAWYEDREGWNGMMRDAIATIGPAFSAQRAMREYARDAYRFDGLRG
ncbi:alpha-glucan family phosphorylase [Sphingosinithalassobacter tenebrarum]|uniref:Alpha-glucan family phosphorylase n=2 Tax=Stakelama tenebrarum TaxID=2711215 RepID=A0A6G6Y9Y3_9SPHN|nr:alpha-glucan family phosphorylase [Sphingosinithalassobacter tenebrarum]